MNFDRFSVPYYTQRRHRNGYKKTCLTAPRDQKVYCTMTLTYIMALWHWLTVWHYCVHLYYAIDNNTLSIITILSKIIDYIEFASLWTELHVNIDFRMVFGFFWRKVHISWIPYVLMAFLGFYVLSSNISTSMCFYAMSQYSFLTDLHVLNFERVYI